MCRASVGGWLMDSVERREMSTENGKDSAHEITHGREHLIIAKGHGQMVTWNWGK